MYYIRYHNNKAILFKGKKPIKTGNGNDLIKMIKELKRIKNESKSIT